MNTGEDDSDETSQFQCHILEDSDSDDDTPTTSIISKPETVIKPREDTDERVLELMQSIIDGRDENVQRLLRSGININTQDRYGFTPLMISAIHNRLRYFKQLLHMGADIRLKNNIGWTALFCACDSSSVDVIQYILNPLIINEDDGNMICNSSSSTSITSVNSIPSESSNGLSISSGAIDSSKSKHRKKRKQKKIIRVFGVKQSQQHHQTSKSNITQQKQPHQQPLHRGALLDVNEVDPEGWSPLFVCCEKGDVDVVNTLLRHGANVSVLTKDRWTCLMIAAQHSHTQVVTVLIDYARQQGMNITQWINHLALRHTTALMLAVVAGDTDTTALFLAHDCELHTKLSLGWNALLFAIERNDTAMVKVLLNKYTHTYFHKVKPQNSTANTTPAQIATLPTVTDETHHDVASTTTTPTATATTTSTTTVDEPTSGLLTPSKSLRHRRSKSMSINNLNINTPATPTATTITTTTTTTTGPSKREIGLFVVQLLQRTQLSKCWDGLQMLVSRGYSSTLSVLHDCFHVDFNRVVYEHKTTLLSLAIEYDQDDVAVLLLQCGVTVDLLSLYTALHTERYDMFEFLVAFVDSSVLDTTLLGVVSDDDIGHYAVATDNTVTRVLDGIDHSLIHELFSYACKKDNVVVIHRLLYYGINANVASQHYNPPLVSAVLRQNVPLVTLLLKSEVDVNVLDDNNNTALSYAVTQKRTDLARMLLERQAVTCYLDPVTNDPHNLLLTATSLRDADMVRLLLTHDADVNSVNTTGCCALMLSAQQGYDEIVHVLVEHGAELNMIDNDLNTALIHAVESGQAHIVQILLDLHVDVMHANQEGESALDVALNGGVDEIIDMIDSYIHTHQLHTLVGEGDECVAGMEGDVVGEGDLLAYDDTQDQDMVVDEDDERNDLDGEEECDEVGQHLSYGDHAVQ